MELLFLKFITIAAFLSCVFGYALRQPQAEIVSQKTASLKPVADLDVSKFSGRWFEVYSSLLPKLSFTKDWVCVTANYKVRDQKDGVLDLFYNGRLGTASGPHYNITGTAMSDGSGNGVLSIKYDPHMGRETYYNDNIDDDLAGELNNNKMASLLDPHIERRERRIVKTHDAPDAKILDVTEEVQSLSVSTLPIVGDVTEKVKTVTSNPTSIADSVTSTASSATDGKTDGVIEKVGDVTEKVKTVTSNPTSITDSATSAASSVTDGVTEKVTSVTDSTPLSRVTEKASEATDEITETSSEPTSAVEAVTEALPLPSEPIEEEVPKGTTTRPPRKPKGRASILNNNKISVLPINVKSKVEHKKQSITNILRSQPGMIRNDLTDLPTKVKNNVGQSIQNDITSIPSSITGSKLAFDGQTSAQSGGIVNRVALFGDEEEVTTKKPLKSTATPQKKPRASILNNNKLSVLPINVQNDVSKRTQSITNIVSNQPPAIQNDLTDIPAKELVPEIPTEVEEKVAKVPITNKEELAEIPTTDVSTEKLSTENVPSKITSYAKTFAKNSKYVVVKLGPKTFGADNKYEYAVVTTPSRLSLGVLARDIQKFNEKYAVEVFEFLKANEFNSLWNRPRPVSHEKNCEYPSAA